MKFIGRLFLFLLAILLVVTTSFLYDFRRVEVKDYGVYSRKLNPIFENYKIAIISDFHNCATYEKVIQKTKEGAPDLIVIIGDLVTSTDTQFWNAKLLLEGLVKIAPCYFVSGNHERWNKHEKAILTMVEETGTIVLNNRVAEITKKNAAFSLFGFEDMIYSDNAMRYDLLEENLIKLREKSPDKNAFQVLLFHRANDADYAVKQGYDLILSGHVHGGQVGIPYIREKILKRAGMSTPYINGYYRKGASQIIVSTGLESNRKRPRFLNPNQLVFVTLHAIESN